LKLNCLAIPAFFQDNYSKYASSILLMELRRIKYTLPENEMVGKKKLLHKNN
jgi:hypothetical protein